MWGASAIRAQFGARSFSAVLCQAGRCQQAIASEIRPETEEREVGPVLKPVSRKKDVPATADTAV